MKKNGKTTTKKFEQVLVSVGRKPNTKTIGLENTTIKTNNKGCIEVDKQQKTNVKNITKKLNADNAVLDTPSIQHVIKVSRTGDTIEMDSKR